jgi:hypothetical protein
MTRDIQKPANLSYHDSDDATDPSVGLNRRELMSRGALLGAAAGAAGLGLQFGGGTGARPKFRIDDTASR